jgi:hypothetical protein
VSTLFEVASDEGFFNISVSANPRFNPMYGYARGVHRFIYKPYLDSSFLFRIAEDESREFSDRSAMFFLNFMDFHHRLTGHDYSNSSEDLVQMKKMDSLNNSDLFGRSDETVFFRSNYLMIAKRFASRLSKYMNSVLTRDANVINTFIITSDHSGAPSPKSQKSGHKAAERFHVPFIVFSNEFNCKRKVVDEYTSSAYLSQMIQQSLSAGMFKVEQLEANLQKRQFCDGLVFSEIIFPGQTYRVQIFKERFIYQLESLNPIRDRLIDLKGYKVSTIDNRTGAQVPNTIETSITIEKFLHILNENSLFEVLT